MSSCNRSVAPSRLDLSWSIVGDIPNINGSAIKAVFAADDVLYTADRSGIWTWSTTTAKCAAPSTLPSASLVNREELLIGSESFTSFVSCTLIVNGILWIGLGDGSLILFDVHTSFPVTKAIRGHKGEVTCILPGLFPQTVITGGADFLVKVWGASGESLFSIGDNHKPIQSLAVHNQQLWTGSSDGLLKAYSLNSTTKQMQQRASTVIASFDKETRKGVTCMVSCERYLLCGCKNGELLKIKGKDISSRRRLHQNQISALLLTKSQVWTGSADRHIYAVNADSFEITHCFGDQGSYIRSILIYDKKIWAVHGKGIRIFALDAFWTQEIDKLKELHGDEINKFLQDRQLIASKVQDLQSNKFSLESQISSLHQDYQKQISVVRKEHKQELEKLVKQYDAVISQHRLQITELTEKNYELQSRSEDASVIISKLAEREDQRQQDLISKDQEIESLSMQRACTEEEVKNLNEVVSTTQNELESIKVELDKTNSHSEQLSVELTQRYQKCTELIKQNENLHQMIKQARLEKECSEVEIESLRKQLEVKEKEIKDSERTVSGLFQRVEDQRIQILDLNETSKLEHDQLVKDMKVKEAEIEIHHEQQVASFQEAIKKLEKSLSDSNQSLHEREIELHRLTIAKKQIEEDLCKSTADKLLLLETAELSREKINDLETNLLSIRTETEKKDQVIQDLSSKVQQLEEKVSIEKPMVCNGVQVSPMVVEEAQDDLHSNHLREIEAKEKKIDEMREIINSYPTLEEIEELRSVCQTAEYRQNTLHNRIHQLQEENQCTKDSISELESTLQAVKEENESLKDSNQVLKEETIKMETLLNHLKTLERDHEVNKNEVGELRKKLELQNSSTKRGSKGQKTRPLEQDPQFKAIRSELRQATEDYKIAVQELMKMKEEMRLKDETLHHQRVENEEVVSRLHSLQIEFHQMEMTINQLEARSQSQKITPGLPRQTSRKERWIPPTGCY